MLLRLLLLMWLSAGVIPPFSFAGIVQFDDSVVIGVSLYRPTDPIVQLCSSNFSSTVLRSDRAFLVEFYNSVNTTDNGHLHRYISQCQFLSVLRSLSEVRSNLRQIF